MGARHDATEPVSVGGTGAQRAGLGADRHEGRRLFAEIERAKSELARLESDHARLLSERQAQATNLRVERLARDRLQMAPITPQVTQYVSDAPRKPVAEGAR